jgi:hypothetical protein
MQNRDFLLCYLVITVAWRCFVLVLFLPWTWVMLHSWRRLLLNLSCSFTTVLFLSRNTREMCIGLFILWTSVHLYLDHVFQKDRFCIVHVAHCQISSPLNCLLYAGILVCPVSATSATLYTQRSKIAASCFLTLRHVTTAFQTCLQSIHWTKHGNFQVRTPSFAVIFMVIVIQCIIADFLYSATMMVWRNGWKLATPACSDRKCYFPWDCRRVLMLLHGVFHLKGKTSIVSILEIPLCASCYTLAFFFRNLSYSLSLFCN